MRYRIHVVCGLLSLVALARAASVPNPKVTGPIPANAVPGDPSHDYPFFSTTVDLASHGYVEEEFFFEGTANRYNTAALATGSIIDSGHPYRTRMVVRRPASPANLNGTVLTEWQQTSRNIDSDALWLSPFHDHLIRRGYAWIGVSAQQAGIHVPATGLKAWSPSRYATLDVTQGGAILDDALSYDIFSQAAQAVRNPTGIDPMGGLPVKWVFAGADTQAANRLVMYRGTKPDAEAFPEELEFDNDFVSPILRSRAGRDSALLKEVQHETAKNYRHSGRGVLPAASAIRLAA